MVTDFGVLVTSDNLVDTIDVSGRVVHDRDIDGSIANDLEGFEDVDVSLLRSDGNGEYRVVDQVTTDNLGRYKFANLVAGEEYIVSVNSNTGDLADGDTLAQQT